MLHHVCLVSTLFYILFLILSKLKCDFLRLNIFGGTCMLIQIDFLIVILQFFLTIINLSMHYSFIITIRFMLLFALNFLFLNYIN